MAEGIIAFPVQAIWDSYKDSMRQAGFQASSDLYIASGLLSYGASAGISSCLLFLI